MKALLYPHYHAGTLPRERFKAVGRSAYEAAVAAFAGGGGDAASLCDGSGALRGDVAAWLRTRVAASLTAVELAPAAALTAAAAAGASARPA